MKYRVPSFSDWLITETTHHKVEQRDKILRALGVEIDGRRVRHYNLIVKGRDMNPGWSLYYDALLNKAREIYDKFPSRMEFSPHDHLNAFRLTFGLRSDVDKASEEMRRAISDGPGTTKYTMEMTEDNGSARALPQVLIDTLWDNMQVLLDPGEAEGLIATDQIT